MTTKQPKLRNRMEVFEILDRLEAIAGGATKLPLTQRAVINPRDIQELVSQLRHSLPQDIAEAQQIIRYRDTIVKQSQDEATGVRKAAERESMEKVSDTQVVKDAKTRAEEIRAQAKKDAADLIAQAEAQATTRIKGADEYAVDVLRKLEEELNTLLLTARRGLEALEAGRELQEEQAEQEEEEEQSSKGKKKR